MGVLRKERCDGATRVVRGKLMSSWRLSYAPLVLLAALPCNPVLGQGVEEMINETPIRVVPWDTVDNGQTIGFGSAVALDGNVLVVGAPEEDSSSDPNDFNTGAVYVFELVGSGWVGKQKLRPPVEIAFEEFGASVDVAVAETGTDLEGTDYIAVGAPGSGGTAYFYKRTNGGAWEFEYAGKPETPDNGDLFGQAVAIDYFVPPDSPTGDYVFIAAVGAPFNRDPMGTGSQEGSISIFQRSGGPPTWGNTQEFFGENGDNLGKSLAMARNIIVAGIEGLDSGGFNAGGALIARSANFVDTAFLYGCCQELIPSAGEAEVGVGLGTVVAADNHPSFTPVAALGAPLSDKSGFNAGKVLVFNLLAASSEITESAVLQAPSPAQGQAFGTSVAISQPILAVGAPGIGVDGTVFLYERGADFTVWDSAGQLTPPGLPVPGTCTGGESLAVRGLTAAVGCPGGAPQDDGVYMFFGEAIFTDGFESGDTAAWSSTTP